MRKLGLFLHINLFAFLMLALFGATSVLAETTVITASIPSKACPQFTIISTNVPEVLADSTQKILVSVQLKDCDESLLSNSSVYLSSNRGAVDHVDAVTASGDVIKQGTGIGVEGVTGADGMLYFNIYSNIPGEVTLYLKADNTLLLGTKSVKFLAIPFPKNISVSIAVPQIIGKLLPGYNEKQSTLPLFVPEKQQFDEAKIVNLGVDLRIPFGLFILLALIVLAIPALSTTNILLLRRIRREQTAETTKIEQEVEEIHEELKAELDKPK